MARTRPQAVVVRLDLLGLYQSRQDLGAAKDAFVWLVDQLNLVNDRGGAYVLEAAAGSPVWQDERLNQLVEDGVANREYLAMCGHGLKDPQNLRPVMKPTLLIMSKNVSPKLTIKPCPDDHPLPHQHLQGRLKSGLLRSEAAAEHTTAFAKALARDLHDALRKRDPTEVNNNYVNTAPEGLVMFQRVDRQAMNLKENTTKMPDFKEAVCRTTYDVTNAVFLEDARSLTDIITGGHARLKFDGRDHPGLVAPEGPIHTVTTLFYRDLADHPPSHVGGVQAELNKLNQSELNPINITADMIGTVGTDLEKSKDELDNLCQRMDDVDRRCEEQLLKIEQKMQRLTEKIDWKATSRKNFTPKGVKPYSITFRRGRIFDLAQLSIYHRYGLIINALTLNKMSPDTMNIVAPMRIRETYLSVQHVDGASLQEVH